ncbi:MAG: GGDEF domain-containing protein, partial [Shewanella sp.]
MKDPNKTASTLAVLQQKLQLATVALNEVNEINEDKNAKLQTLLQFIGHLSLACKGQNLELDNKLAKLRNHLTSFERVDESLPELVDVERLLKSQYHHVMTQLEDSRADLTKVIRQLQSIIAVPD